VADTTSFHHYAYVRQGNSHRLFVDGMEVAAGTFTDGPGDTTGRPLSIGAQQVEVGFSLNFDGLIDELGICNRPLSAPEIQAIATGPRTIHVGSTGLGALPTITDPVIIDGFTQPGASPDSPAAGNDAVLLIELDGTAAGDDVAGLHITAGNSTVRGLVINRWGGDGVLLADNGGNVLEQNYIGTGPDGSTDLGNGGAGVLIVNSSSNHIQQNIIAFNGTPPAGDNDTGVAIESGTGNSILGNFIFSQIGLGIDLGHDNVTANDAGDGDTGANNLQNFPVITAATVAGGQTTIEGTLHSDPGTQYRMEFFANDAADPSGFGEGQTFLGFTLVTTDAAGNAVFSFAVDVALPEGTPITATATDVSGNTSEFSAAVAVAAPPPAPPPAPAPAPQPAPPAASRQRLTFRLLSRHAAFRNEVGLFVVDDASGRIGTLQPGDPGYAAAALTRGRVIFGRNASPGALRRLRFPAGVHLGFYLVQHGARAQVLARNPGNALRRQPRVFFSIAAANPDGVAHVRWLGRKRLGFEDLVGGGDRDFNDLVMRFAARRLVARRGR
jgi:hypothetical protein